MDEEYHLHLYISLDAEAAGLLDPFEVIAMVAVEMGRMEDQLDQSEEANDDNAHMIYHYPRHKASLDLIAFDIDRVKRTFALGDVKVWDTVEWGFVELPWINPFV